MTCAAGPAYLLASKSSWCVHVQVEGVTLEAAALSQEVKSLHTRLELQEGHHRDQLQQTNENHAGGATCCAESCSQRAAPLQSSRQDDLTLWEAPVA